MTDVDTDPSLARRFGALLIDWFIALATAALITGTAIFGENMTNGWIPLVMFFIEVSIVTGLLGFSIGKRLTGLRIINADGRPIGLLRSLLRTALLCLVVPAVIMTQDKRGLHDLAAGSKVVLAHPRAN